MSYYSDSTSANSFPSFPSIHNGEYTKQLYELQQEIWLKEHPDIKIGSEVIINALYCFLSQEERNAFGWILGYPAKLDSITGEKVIIKDINVRNGLLLNCNPKILYSYGNWFPFYTVDVNPIDLFMLFPDGKEEKIKNLVAGHRYIANIILNYKAEDNIYFVQGDRKISAFDLYNKFLESSPRIFLNTVELF